MPPPTSRPRLPLLLPWLAVMAGCATSQPTVARAEDEPFFCQPEVKPEPPWPVPVIDLPAGRLDIVCQPEPSETSPDAPDEEAGEETEEKEEALAEYHRKLDEAKAMQERRLARRCRFIVQAVPLVDVALALSAATGYDLSVQPEAMPLRVGVSLRDATLDEFIRALASANGHIRLDFNDQRGHLSWHQGRRRPRTVGCGPEIVVRMMKIPPGVPRRQLASLVCHNILSERGRLSLLGDELFVTDMRQSVEKILALVRQLDPTTLKEQEDGSGLSPAESAP